MEEINDDCCVEQEHDRAETICSECGKDSCTCPDLTKEKEGENLTFSDEEQFCSICGSQDGGMIINGAHLCWDHISKKSRS